MRKIIYAKGNHSRNSDNEIIGSAQNADLIVDLEVQVEEKDSELIIDFISVCKESITASMDEQELYKIVVNPYDEVNDSIAGRSIYKTNQVGNELFRKFTEQLVEDLEELAKEPNPLVFIDNYYECRRDDRGNVSFYLVFWAVTEDGQDIMIDNLLTLRTSNHEPWTGRIPEPLNFKDIRIADSHNTYEHYRKVAIDWVKRRCQKLRKQYPDG
jgi:hypothetical protein